MEESQSQIFDNVTNYMNVMFEQKEDRVIEHFAQVVGSDDPSTWKEYGYSFATIFLESDLLKKAYLLIRGGDRVVTAVTLEVVTDSQGNFKIVTTPLSSKEAKKLLGGN